MNIVLCVRNPDFENEYTVEGDVRVIDIDLGASFNGLRDIAELGAEAQAHIDGWRAQVADLPDTSSVRADVLALCEQAESYLEDDGQ